MAKRSGEPEPRRDDGEQGEPDADDRIIAAAARSVQPTGAATGKLRRRTGRPAGKAAKRTAKAATKPAAKPVTKATRKAGTRPVVRKKPGGAGPQWRSPGYLVGLGALAVVVVVLLTTAVLLGIQNRGADAREQRRVEVLQTAREQVRTLVSISADTADRDVARLRAGATGDFAREFQDGALAQAVKRAGVQSTAEISEAGVERVDEDAARVLVAASANVRNTATPDGDQLTFRIAVELQRDGDRWLVSKVEFVQ